MIQEVTGGVCAPRGFRTAGIHCGVKAGMPDKKDLALIVSDVPCKAAGTFTTNQVKAAPVYVSMEQVKHAETRAIVCNSGNANACAPKGEENARRMCQETARVLGIPADEVLVASTGVIGQTLNIEAIVQGLPKVAAALSSQGNEDAAHAIMTTDSVIKTGSVKLEIGGKTVTIGGIAKGSGMIHPNMGTMLSFLTTDADIDKELLTQMLQECVKTTFNRISVDGDTSTNDTCFILANGLAGNPPIREKSEDYALLKEAVESLCRKLAIKMAKDGEGCTKLITCQVKGAATETQGEVIAKSVIRSPLVKTAMFGEDANWGRVLCAMGYSGMTFDPEKVEVSFASEAGEVAVCVGGRGLPFDEEVAKRVLSAEEVTIQIRMQEGEEEVTAWGCDLTYDYVKLNGDYRT